MKVKNKSKAFIFLTILISILIAGSFWLIASRCPEQYTELISADGVIQAVSPPPNSKIPLGCYTRKNLQNIRYHFGFSDIHNKTNWVESGGVNVKTFSNNELVKLESSSIDNKNMGPFEDRVILYLDNKIARGTIVWHEQDAPLTSDGLHSELAGAYIFGSNTFLFPGNHKAKLIINTKSGKILEYEWLFTITWK